MPKKGCMASFSKFQPKALRIFLSCTYCRCKIFSGYPTIFPYSKAWNNPPKNSPVTYVQLSFFFHPKLSEFKQKRFTQNEVDSKSCFLFTLITLQKMIQFDQVLFFKWVGEKPPTRKTFGIFGGLFRVFSSEQFRDCPGASIWAALDATNRGGRGVFAHKKRATSFGKGHQNLDFVGTF